MGCLSKALWMFAGFALFFFFFFQYLLFISEPVVREDKAPGEVLYKYIHEKFEDDWLSTLRTGPIHHVETWNPFGLSIKFKVIFENGKVASGKIIRPFSFWDYDFLPQIYRETDPEQMRYSRPAGGDFQGLGELGSFFIDRALGWNRKPPTAGRIIPSTMFYATNSSWWGFLMRCLPEFGVEVVLITWFDSIKVSPPPENYVDIMLHKEKGSDYDMWLIRQIIRVFLFDFLVDDHDRIEKHNWLKDSREEYIFWDSGLAFRYGPYGKLERLKDIYCGYREWMWKTSEENEDGHCSRICMFNREDIERLKDFEGTNSLGRAVREKMKKDPLFPIMDLNIYYPARAQFPKVTYRPQDFLEGIDYRRSAALKYVEECIELYGEDKVFV